MASVRRRVVPEAADEEGGHAPQTEPKGETASRLRIAKLVLLAGVLITVFVLVTQKACCTGLLGIPPLVDPVEARVMSLKATADVMNEAGIRWWIKDGTLLESVRTGKLLEFDDPWDSDVGIMKEDVAKLGAVRHLAYERWGSPLIGRTDRWWLPSWSPFMIKRPAFRLYYGTYLPCFYVDIDEMEPREDDPSVLWNPQFDEHIPLRIPMDAMFPLATCVVEGVKLPCPKDSERVLELTYGPTWRTPQRGFKAFDIDRPDVPK